MTPVFDVTFEAVLDDDALAQLRELFAIDTSNVHDDDRVERGVGVMSVEGADILVVLSRTGRKWRLAAFPPPNNELSDAAKDQLHTAATHLVISL